MKQTPSGGGVGIPAGNSTPSKNGQTLVWVLSYSASGTPPSASACTQPTSATAKELCFIRAREACKSFVSPASPRHSPMRYRTTRLPLGSIPVPQRDSLAFFSRKYSFQTFIGSNIQQSAMCCYVLLLSPMW